MEHQSSNNYSNNGNLAHGNGNMFNAVTDGSAHGGGIGYLAQRGPMTSLLLGTDELNLETAERSTQRPPTFTQLLQERNFSSLNGGRLVIDLNIESGLATIEEVVAAQESGSNPSPNISNLNMSGPSAGNYFGPGTELGPVRNDSSRGPRCICGRKRKTTESEGTSLNLDLNECATPVDQEVDEECDCEVSPVQGSSSGSMIRHGASSGDGHSNQLNLANPGRGSLIGGASFQRNPNIAHLDENRNRSVRSRRRGTPRRSIISVPGNSSGEDPIYQPPSISVGQGMTDLTAGELQRALQALIARRASIERAANSSTSERALGWHAFCSRLGVPHFSPSYGAASLFDAQGGTLGQASHDQNIAFAQRNMHIPMLQSDTNSQPGGSLTRNVAENPLFNPTGMVQQLNHRPAVISIRNVNQGHSGGHGMQLRTGVSRRHPRLNGEQNIDQPIGNVLAGANLGNVESFGPAYDPPIAEYLAGGERRLDRDMVRQLLRGRHTSIQGNQVLGIGEDNNEFDDMRLDIDRMTYEDLLALGEHIGNVNTGLSEEAILKRLKRELLIVKDKTPEEIESCSICLDEYANCEELGKLNCGHYFHFDCIKQWLMRKNFCPICRKTALPPN